jgi:hypothetical protein
MKRLAATVVVTATVALLGWVAPAQASPITYTETATASGVFNGTSFTNKLVTITFFADTSNVAPFGNGCGPCLVNLSTSATVNVPGIGTGTFIDPTGIIDFPQPFLDPDIGGFAAVALVDAAPQTSGLLLLATLNNALIGYGLATSIGPITGGAATPDPTISYNTTLGIFQWNPYPESSTFTATAAPVPEPATLTLTALGLAGVVLRYRRRRSVL